MTAPAFASEDKVQQLLELGGFFADHGQWREAAEMLALALRLKPDCTEAREQLARVRRAQRQGQVPAAGSTLKEAAWEEFRRRALDGAHFLGLARLYQQKGEVRLATECLEIAKAKAPSNPAPHKMHGGLLLQRGNAQAAARELARAAHLDPFDRETAEMLGLAEHKRQRFEPAAAATARAFLLVGELHSPDAERLRRRILTLKRILGWGSAEMARLFEQAREQLQIARDRVEWHRERFLEEEGLPHGGAWFGATPARARPGLIALAGRLRRMAALSSLADGELFRLTAAVQEELYAAGSLVFAQRGDGRDLYLVEEGVVHLERTGGYGTFPLRSVAAGELAGEASWLLRQPRATDAVAARPSRLLRIDSVALERHCEESPELSQQLLWCLWHSLAAKLRAANEQLREIFAASSLPHEVLTGHLQPATAGERIHLASQDKVRLFREHGLSQRELATLATFSREKRFAAGAYLFREGDPGDELYAVVEGRVLISKYIQGGGDEALALLGRGEFFGEMALIDGQPRSADARAEGAPATVLALDQATLRDLLALDPAASADFLRLLCRLLARRLTEADEKVLGWRILGGGQAEEAEPEAQRA